MVVKGLWIISDAGIPLISSPGNSGVKVDSDLFSGLLTAIHSFSKSAGLSTLRQTETQNLKLVYGFRSQILFVLAGDKDIDTEVLETHLVSFQNQFFSAFEALVWDKFLDGAIASGLFEDFETEITKIIGQRKVSKSSIDSMKNAFARFIKHENAGKSGG